MKPVSYIIENPYEARLIAELPTYKDGKERRRERRKKARK
jgi:hypothetical protein